MVNRHMVFLRQWDARYKYWGVLEGGLEMHCTCGSSFGALVLFDIPMEEVVIKKKRKQKKQRACNEKVNIYILLQVHFFSKNYSLIFLKK